jgi:hypothetical protein
LNPKGGTTLESGGRKPDGEKDRRRFVAALGLFLVWVAALGVMAVLSGRRPESTPAAAEDR